MDALLQLFSDVGAQLTQDEGGRRVARWRGLTVRSEGDPEPEARRLKPVFEALAHLPDPVPVAQIDLVRHGPDGARPAFVPVIGLADGPALRALHGDSFLVVLDRDGGAMTVLGANCGGDAVRVEHRLPRAVVGPAHGLATERSAAAALDPGRRAGPDAARARRKTERLRPLLRCVRCPERAPLEDQAGGLRCTACGQVFALHGGVPILLPDPADDGEPAGGDISSNSYTRQALALFDAHADGLVLDCGCGQPAENLPQVVHLEVCRYENVDVVGSGEVLPFADGVFDAAVCESVLEHVPDPRALASELQRVLKPGAPLRVDAPFLAPFHGYPNHYHNFTQTGLDRLLEAFEKIEGGIDPHQEPWLAVGWILRLVREGLPDEALRADLDRARVGELLGAVAEGRPPAVLHPLSDEVRRSLAAGFFFFGRKPGGERGAPGSPAG